MNAAVAKELPKPVAVSADDAVATMALSWAEILIVSYYRGGNVTAEQLEAAIAMAKASAKPGG